MEWNVVSISSRMKQVISQDFKCFEVLLQAIYHRKFLQVPSISCNFDFYKERVVGNKGIKNNKVLLGTIIGSFNCHYILSAITS